jgi:UDP-N-acetylmuramate--alanine ligase
VHYAQVEVALIGQHNVLNALAVFGLGILLGVTEDTIRKAFREFGGVKRRCEKKGEVNQIMVLDDYAHHPTEIRTTLNGIRSAIGNRRLIAVFQPHRYSRTKDCLGTYGGIFDAVDELFVTDIYTAGETPIPGVTVERLLEEVKQHTKVSCRYTPREVLCDTLKKLAHPQDVIVTLGAGDVTNLSAELVKKLY